MLAAIKTTSYSCFKPILLRDNLAALLIAERKCYFGSGPRSVKNFWFKAWPGFFLPSNTQACKLLELRQLPRNMLLGRPNCDEQLNILLGV